MSDFSAGDRVVMVGVGERYNWTRDGSTGTVVRILTNGNILIHFDYLTRTPDALKKDQWIWDVKKEHVQHIGSGQSRLERKIKVMFERQPYYKKLVEAHHA